MLDLEKIKKEFETLMQKIDLNYGGLSKKEKSQLIFIARKFMDCVTSNAIFEDYNEQEDKTL